MFTWPISIRDVGSHPVLGSHRYAVRVFFASQVTVTFWLSPLKLWLLPRHTLPSPRISISASSLGNHRQQPVLSCCADTALGDEVRLFLCCSKAAAASAVQPQQTLPRGRFWRRSSVEFSVLSSGCLEWCPTDVRHKEARSTRIATGNRYRSRKIKASSEHFGRSW